MMQYCNNFAISRSNRLISSPLINIYFLIKSTISKLLFLTSSRIGIREDYPTEMVPKINLFRKKSSRSLISGITYLVIIPGMSSEIKVETGNSPRFPVFTVR